MEHVQPEALVRDVTREPLDAFVEQMGLLAQADNMPRISGRIMGLFLVEGRRPIGLRELAERLQVSRASASTNARMLAQIGFIERVAVPGDRQDYYRLAADPFTRFVQTMITKLTASAEAIARAAASFPAERRDARARVDEFAAFHRAAAENMASLVERVAGRDGADARGPKP